MKTQKIFFIIIIALLVSIVVIQLFVKQKVKLDGGLSGTAGVFNKSASPEVDLSVLETEAA